MANNSDINELKKDIDATREDLAETVDALVGKADISGRTKAKMSDVGDSLGGAAHDAGTAAQASIEHVAHDSGARNRVGAVIAGALAAIFFLVWWRRR